jgi:hypothetical protein
MDRLIWSSRYTSRFFFGWRIVLAAVGCVGAGSWARFGLAWNGMAGDCVGGAIVRVLRSRVAVQEFLLGWMRRAKVNAVWSCL